MAHRDGFLQLAGRDGLFTLLLANGVIAASAGLSWLWMLVRVYRVARHTPTVVDPQPLTLVPGLRLEASQVTPVYAARLDRAQSLLLAGHTRTLMLLGGVTGGSLQSEASCGRDYLTQRGLSSDVLLLEDGSRHTLENLRHARAQMNEVTRNAACILVTSRSHLARCLDLAQGLGMRVVPCAAEAHFRLTPKLGFQLVREAYLLHWYHVGRLWSRWTRNAVSLERIS